MTDLEARISALESVVDKYLPVIQKSMTTKKSSSKTTTTATTGDDAQAPDPVVTSSRPSAHPIGLMAPAYDVPWKGQLRRATVETLSADPEFLAYMRQEFPTCFVK
jgi:hypothetical protein